MSKRPQDTSAEEPDGGNPHIRFRGGPGRGNQPGLLNIRIARRPARRGKSQEQSRIPNRFAGSDKTRV